MRSNLPAFSLLVAVGFWGCSGGSVEGGHGAALIVPSADPSTSTTSGAAPEGSFANPSPPPSINVEVGTTVDSQSPVDLANGGLAALRNGACAGWQAKTEALPAILELVMDASNSMNKDAPGGAPGDTRWTVARDALLKTLDGLSPASAVGILYFPNSPGPASTLSCVATDAIVPITVLGALGSNERKLLSDSLGSVILSNSTPTHDAYKFASDTLAQSTLPGKKFLVLITDGAPTVDLGCKKPTNGVNKDAIVAEVAAAKAKGIGTFVIGSPGSEPAVDWLSRAATTGGTARPGCSDAGPTYCHYDMTGDPNFSASLQAALAAITGQVVSCNYPVPTPPGGGAVDPNKVNIVYSPGGVAANASLILRNDAVGCDQGWQYNAAGTEVVLCAQTCQMVKADSAPLVEVFGGCDTQVIIK